MRCSAEARHMCMPRRPVVILAEGNKEEMDKHLKRALRDTQLEWHTRQVGHPSLRRLPGHEPSWPLHQRCTTISGLCAAMQILLTVSRHH